MCKLADFVSMILSGDIAELIGEELLAPTIAAIAASWAILAFAALCDAFKVSMSIIFNLKDR